MLLTIVIAVIASVILLFAGYLLGVRAGYHAREQLWEQLLAQQSSKVDKSGLQAEPVPSGFKKTVENDFFDEVQAFSTVMPEQIQLAVELSNLQFVQKHRDELNRIMSEIADATQFKTVLLSDENGLPLAVSRNAEDIGRLAAISGFVVIFGQHIRRNDDYMPVSLLFRDVHCHQVLCRIFKVGQQRLVLTAVTHDQLSLNALDLGLSKVLRVLDTDSVLSH